MPQTVIAYIAEVFYAAGVTYGAGELAFFLAEVFVYAASAYVLSRVVGGPKRGAAGLTGGDINYFSTDATLRIPYGRVRTGGMETIPPITSGNNNERLHKVLTLSGCEIDSFNYFHFDATTIDISQVGPMAFTSSDGRVNSGPFANQAFIRAYRGTSTDSADRILCDANSQAFNKSRAPGFGKIALAFDYKREVYQSVPQVSATYQAKRCYDPRLDSSPGAAPSNPSFIAWTTNPALVLTDYIMGAYGGDYPSTEIDWTTVVNAANTCDTSVAIPTGNEALYSCNGVVETNTEFTDNVKALVDAMLGKIINTGGKWKMFAGAWTTPTFTVPKNAWVSPLSIKFEQGMGKRFNSMRTWFIDPLHEWQRMTSATRRNSTYLAADGGGSYTEAETDQLFCTSETEGQRKSEFLLRQSRNQITIAGRLPPRYQDIALWDTGTIVFDEFGWASKTFRCVGCDLNVDGSMDVVFTEEQSTDWTNLVSGDYNNPSTVALPQTNNTTPTEPTNLTITQNINGTLGFDIGLPVIDPPGSAFQIIRSTNSADASVGTVVWQGSATHADLVMPTSRHWYYARTIAPGPKQHGGFTILSSAYLLSAYFPNTFGIAAFGLPTAVAPNLTEPTTDPYFRFSTTLGDYWAAETNTTIFDDDGNISRDSTNVFSISPTGGSVGGRLILAVNTFGVNTTGWSYRIWSLAKNLGIAAKTADGLEVGATVVSRISSLVAINASSGSQTKIKLMTYAWTGIGSLSVSNTPNLLLASQPSPETDARTMVANVGKWMPRSTSDQLNLSGSAINPTSYPYMVACLVVGQSAANSPFCGVMEFDTLNVSLR